MPMFRRQARALATRACGSRSTAPRRITLCPVRRLEVSERLLFLLPIEIIISLMPSQRVFPGHRDDLRFWIAASVPGEIELTKLD